MAISRPPVLPTLATDAAYPAGTDPWSGQPPRVALSAGTQARGLTPQSDLPAEFANWLWGVGFDFVKYLDSWWNPPLTSNNLPQLRFLDAAGNGRSLADHNGYLGLGRVSQPDNYWDFANGTLSAGVQAGTPWSAILGTGSALTILGPTTSYNDRFLQITPSSTATTGQTNMTSWPFIVANTAGMSLVLEFEFGMSVAGVASNVNWYAGLSATTDPSTDVSICCIEKKYNTAYYQSFTGNGTLSGLGALTGNPLPTVGAFPTDKIKFEIQGSASPYAAYQVKIWINDVLVGTVASGSIPLATPLRLFFGSLNEGGAPSGSPLAYVGPIIRRWNRYTSGPNL